MPLTITFVSSIEDESGKIIPEILEDQYKFCKLQNINSLMLFSRGSIIQSVSGGTSKVNSFFTDVCNDDRLMPPQIIISEEPDNKVDIATGFGYRGLSDSLLNKIPNKIPVFKLKPKNIDLFVNNMTVKLLMNQFIENQR